uniref:Uncharacterized protein n=1 Tax=Russula compacta TaxID=40490 RepID=A0A2S0U3J1_9AGAM|nr:hypothetical protein [Russula compacta]AWB36063.1 hypothetical protein [Russula compacta]
MSITNITFLHDLIPFSGIHVFNSPNYRILYFWDGLEISKFLDNLESDKNFVVTAELIGTNIEYLSANPKISLSELFVINRDSSSDLISDYLLKQACLACNIYKLESHQIECPAILLKYKEINLNCF